MALQTVREKVVKALVALSGNPRPHGVEKLSRDPRLWRVRCGKYRIIYWINDEAGIVVALIVRHRKDAYRDIDKLDPAPGNAHDNAVAQRPVVRGLDAVKPPALKLMAPFVGPLPVLKYLPA
jgi:mRNA interferase RelE/StbE